MPVSTSATPYPFAHSILKSLMTAILTPGTWNCDRSCCTVAGSSGPLVVCAATVETRRRTSNEIRAGVRMVSLRTAIIARLSFYAHFEISRQRWVTRAVTQFFDAEMRRPGIRPTQGSILASLQTKDSWNMAELSDWLGMDRTTLVRNLRPLQRDGLVKAGGGGRGRLVELTITAKGRKQIEKLTPAWKSAQSAVVKTLGEKRWSAILTDLETAALALNK